MGQSRNLKSLARPQALPSEPSAQLSGVCGLHSAADMRQPSLEAWLSE